MNSIIKRKLNAPPPPHRMGEPKLLNKEQPCEVKRSIAMNRNNCLGLFAKRDINVGEILADYGGAFYWESDLRKDDRAYSVALQDGTGVVINSVYPVLSEPSGNEFGHSYLGRYANSNIGTKYLLNAKIIRKVSKENVVNVYLVATKDIDCGEEILCSYGAGYTYDD
jgi:hypothetical protein